MCRVYTYCGKSWQVRALIQSKSTPSSARESPRLFQLNQARPRALVTSLCWLCGVPQQHRPQQRLATHLRTSSKGLLLSTSAQRAGLAGGTGRCTSALLPPPHGDRGTRTGEDSSEAGRGNLRLVIPCVREVAGDELCMAWLSSPARHRCTL